MGKSTGGYATDQSLGGKIVDSRVVRGTAARGRSWGGAEVAEYTGGGGLDGATEMGYV